MGWGLILGHAATTGVKTYESLSENSRQEDDQRIKDEAAARAKSRFSQEQSDAAGERQSLADLAAAQPGASASDNISAGDGAAAGAAPVSVKSGGLPTDRMNLGGPKDDSAPQDPKDVQAASADETAETGRAAAIGAQPSQPAAPAAVSRGTSAPVSQADAAKAAWLKNPRSQGAYNRWQAALKSDAEAAKDAQEARINEIKIKAANHALDRKDIEDSRLDASQAAERAAGTVNAYGEASDDVSATDPRYINTTKQVLDSLLATHDKFADGKVAKASITPDGVSVKYFDAKTNKPLSEDTFSTIGDMRHAVQVAGMSTDAEHYSKVIGLNTLTKIANEVQASKISTAKSNAAAEATNAGLEADVAKDTAGARRKTAGYEADNKATALGYISDTAKVIQDPTGEALLDPQSRREAEAKADMAGMLYPDSVKYKKPVVIKDEATGKETTIYTEGNRLRDAITNSAPPTTAKVQSSNGDPVEYPIQRAVDQTVKNFAKLNSETKGDPNATYQAIVASYTKQGFDPRTAAYYAKQAMKLGLFSLEQQGKQAAAAATPASVKSTAARASAIPQRSVASKIFHGDLSTDPNRSIASKLFRGD